MDLIDKNKLDSFKYRSASERMDLPVDYMVGWNDAVDGIMANAPTVEAIPIEWIRKWMDRQNSWNLEGVITLMRDWNERKEETERTCYNCKRGAFGFDGDLGCSLWHRGIYDQKICGCWEGFERKEE